MKIVKFEDYLILYPSVSGLYVFFINVGAVYLDDSSVGFVPIFGNARAYLSEKRKSFFCDLKLGYSPASFGDVDCEGGMFAALALGYSFGNVDVALQSMRQNFSVEDRYSGIDVKAKGIIGLSVGFKL